VLKDNIARTVRALLAVGVDPERSCLFRQSHVRCTLLSHVVLRTGHVRSHIGKATAYIRNVPAFLRACTKSLWR
jgi:tryptophanyl-tRNA synthetase